MHVTFRVQLGECLLDGQVVEAKGEVEKAEKRKRLAQWC